MPSIVRIKPEVKTPYKVKESYGTIKKRLFDSSNFIEVTLDKGKKATINKDDIRCVAMEKVTTYIEKK